jgi:hypothetical protein
MRPLLICLATALAYAAGAAAQETSFSVAADRTAVSLGEQIQITAQIVTSKKLSGAAAPQIPKSEDFDVVGSSQNQSSSTSIQIVNGKMTQTVTMNYLFYFNVAPKRTGSFTFPALTVNIDGASYSSNSFVVTAGKEPVQTSDVKFSLSLSKKSLFVGEQALLTLQIAIKAQAPAQVTQQGFSQSLDRMEKSLGREFTVARLSNQVKGVSQAIGGEAYSVFRVQYAVFPLTAGAVTIAPQSLDYVALKRVQNRRRADPFFDDFFSNGFFDNSVQQIPKTVLSNATTVHVLALPPAPAGFSGAVGSFSLNAQADPRQVAAGDAVTLSIGIRGNTRPGSMGEIVMPKLPDCEVFAPEKHVSIDTSANGISCQKGYKYLVVPRQEGTLVIPPVEWVYFDPASQSYKTLGADTMKCTVTKGKSTQAGQTRYLTQEEIRQVGQDIRYIKTGVSLKKQSDQPYKDPVFFFLYPLPFLIAAFSFLYKVQSKRYARDATLELRRKAAGRAFKELSGLGKRAPAMSAPEFLSRLCACLEEFISHNYGFAAAGKTLDELKRELLLRGAREDTAAGIVSFIESLDRYRFGRASLDAASKAGLLDKTAGLVTELKKRKKGKPS